MARDEAAREEAANAAAAAAAKKRGGIAKGIGKKLFGADGGSGGSGKDKETLDKDDDEDQDRENEYVSPNFGLEEKESAGAGAGRPPLPPPLPPAQSDEEPGATPLRNLGGDMDFERKDEEEDDDDDEQEPGGIIRPADSKEEFLRKAADLQRQSEAVFSAAAAPAPAPALAKKDKVVGTSVAVPHDAVGNDMDASSLSQTAILSDQQLRSALEAAPMPKKTEDSEDEKEEDGNDNDDNAAKEEAEAAETEAAANSISPDQSTEDMMSDILGVTMPDDIEETTMEEGDEAAASEAKEKDELMDEKHEKESDSDAEVDETDEKQVDSLAAEEDKFNDIPPPSPKPVAAKDSAAPQAQASEKPIDDALRRADEALAAAKLFTSPSADEPKPDDEESPTETDRAAVEESAVAPAATDQEMDDLQQVDQDHVDKDPIQPTDSAEDQLDDDLRKVTEDLAVAGIATSDEDEAAEADVDAHAAADTAATTDIDSTTPAVALGTTTTDAPEDEEDDGKDENEAEGGDKDEIPATPEVSVDDVALEAVRLSAIDDEVSPIKLARGEDVNISQTSGGSAVNLDLSGPGGDGAWESDEKVEKVPPSEPKTLQEKTEAAVAAASAAIAASRLPQGSIGEEDPPAISLSLTDESLDDRKKRAADLEASRSEGSRRSPKSQSSRSRKKKKKKATWRAVVDEASGDVYYYNRKTRETTWDKPEGVEIDDRKRTFPDESGMTTVASEEVVAAEESTETIPLEGVTSDLTDNDASKTKDANKHQHQVNGDHRDTADGGGEDEVEDPEAEAEHEEDQASGGKWKAVVDKTSGQTYYYHTVTQETTWDKPAGYVEKKGMVKRGRQALGGLIRRSTKHVIGGKATSKDEDDEQNPMDATDDAGDTDTMTNAKASNADKDDVVNYRNRYEVKDAETREAEAKKRGKALKFLRLKSAKASSGDGSSRNVKSLGKKKEGSGTPAVANSPDAHSQNQADISSVVDADGYSGMETSDEGEHIQGAADFSVAAMDTPDKVKLPKSAMKGRFLPSLRSPSEKDELNISDGSTDEIKNGEAADNSNETSTKKGEDANQIWRAIIDANTLNTYYYNARTKETTWDKPEGFQDVSKEELTASLE